ncbi:hypothetical protein SNEBB_002892 [Seison nebaliae]|nr:hypothetical protein SNEBB_002892 [Seison nebaliae]
MLSWRKVFFYWQFSIIILVSETNANHCKINNDYLNDGEVSSEHPCETCRCIHDRIVCNIVECSFPKCANPKMIEGECCPVCMEDLEEDLCESITCPVGYHCVAHEGKCSRSYNNKDECETLCQTKCSRDASPYYCTSSLFMDSCDYNRCPQLFCEHYDAPSIGECCPKCHVDCSNIYCSEVHCGFGYKAIRLADECCDICVIDECSPDIICPEASSPVCGSNDVTYANQCYFRKAACLSPISIKSYDECEGEMCMFQGGSYEEDQLITKTNCETCRCEKGNWNCNAVKCELCKFPIFTTGGCCPKCGSALEMIRQFDFI